MQRVGGGLGVAVEQPLRGVVGVGLGQAVGVALGGDLLPVGEVEGDFDQRGVGDVQLLVDAANGFVVFGGGAEAPDGGEVGGVVRHDWGTANVKFSTRVQRDRQLSHHAYNDTLLTPNGLALHVCLWIFSVRPAILGPLKNMFHSTEGCRVIARSLKKMPLLEI